jgi:hypothetical protein
MIINLYFEGPSHGDSNTGEEDDLLKSKTLSKDRKRYYLDLKENQSGRFLRVNLFIFYYVILITYS